MLSAGNDIVALSEINVARTNTKQFYSKILSEYETALYEQLSAKITFEQYVWLLWSIKESAYKFLKRLDPELLFTPVKFEIKQLEVPVGYSTVSFDRGEQASTITGFFQIDNYHFYSRSVIYAELISSVVDNDKHFNGVYNGVKYIQSTDNAIQSVEVRAFLIDKLKKETEITNLAVHKNAAHIPILFSGHKKVSVPVSLSHHGHYIGYSFKL